MSSWNGEAVTTLAKTTGNLFIRDDESSANAATCNTSSQPGSCSITIDGCTTANSAANINNFIQFNTKKQKETSMSSGLFKINNVVGQVLQTATFPDTCKSKQCSIICDVV